MKSFSQFCLEAYDASFMSGAQIIRTGEGGRIAPERRKTDPERRRTRRGPGGTRLPAKPYKPRSDIGTTRSTETRVQQPEQERGSTDVKAAAAAAAKEERKKAALARIAARKAGESVPTVQQPKPKDLEKLEKQATEILSKRKPKKPKGEGRIERTTKNEYTRDEKKRMIRAGKKLHGDIIRGKERDASYYQP
jgi:hypothetical protein